MENTSLSVIVPVYNVEKYLGTCIESLLAQTYDNLQIILVNDCSPDGSLGILRDYENRYPDKITVIDSKENLRQGGARNLGIKSSQSEYVGFVDADDFVHPRMYEVLMKEALENGSNKKWAKLPQESLAQGKRQNTWTGRGGPELSGLNCLIRSGWK